MTKNQKYEHWLDIATYDLETAEAMLSGGRWLYVAFMCQQAVEKLVKGLYTLYIDDNIPRIHNISALIKPIPVEVPKEKFILFDTLSAYYINNRYPEFMAKLSSRVTEKEATKILAQTKEVFSWLLTLKP